MSLRGVGAIGVVVAGITGALAYTGSLPSPERADEDRTMTAVRAVDWTHSDASPDHPDDVCAADWFKSAGQAVSRTAQPGHVPLLGHVALAGGMPFRTDAPETTHSLSPRFNTAPDSRQLISAANQAAPWSIAPVQSFEPAGPAVEAERTTLLDNVLNPAGQPVSLTHLIGMLTSHGDATRLTTPADRRQTAAGSAALDRAETDDGARCSAVGHDPAMLRAVTDPFDDSLRNARSAAYVRLFSLPPQPHDDQPRGSIGPDSAARRNGRS